MGVCRGSRPLLLALLLREPPPCAGMFARGVSDEAEMCRAGLLGWGWGTPPRRCMPLLLGVDPGLSQAAA